MDFVGIGERIRYIRKVILKMKREEFAEMLDTNTSSIGRIERGEVKSLDIELLHKISAKSGYSIDEIVNGFLDSSKQNIIKRINNLLNVLTEEELEFQFENIHRFTQIMHSRNIKDIQE